MRTIQLKIDAGELRNFGRGIRQFPKFVRPATAALLNKVAYNIRTEAKNTIFATMVIRNARFVAGRLRYLKANPNLPVGRQFAIVGSWADKPRFGGWKRQVGQAEPPRQGGKRTLLLAARGGDESHQVKPRFRMKPTSHFISAADMRSGRTPAIKRHILIRRVFKEKFVAPFILGKPSIPGLYRRVGKKIELLQMFRKDRKRTKRIDWLRTAISKGLKRVDLNAEWNRACQHAWKQIKVR